MSGGRKNIRAAERTELLAPACDKEGLIAVFHAGADAVYLGGEQFGARAYANNFSKEDLLWSLDYAHIHGKKICLAVNTLLKDKELWGQLYDYIEPFYEAGLDAVIVQDYGVLSFLKKHFPGLALHASTQMTVTDLSGALYLKEQGVSRVVLARELSAEEIREIKEVSQMEIEVFIHGALCYCYSGQCLLSSMIGGRSGNRGRCAQPCRLSYQILTGKSQKGTYPLSLKDLCTVEQLPTLLEMGVDSLKIEGRMKRPEYAAGVTEIYRKYMDRYFREEFSSGDKIEPKDREQLLALGNRGGFTKGYLFCQNGREMITQGTASFSAPSGETIDQEMKEKHIGKQLKEPVTGYFLAKVGEEIQLTVTNQEHAVTVKGGIAEEAKKAAADSKQVEKILLQTGTTPFQFQTLKVELEGNCFLPVREVKELRRRALGKLEAQILLPMRRQIGQKVSKKTADFSWDMEEKTPGGKIKQDGKVVLHAAAETMEQFHVIIKTPEIHRVYVDSHLLGETKQEAARRLGQIIEEGRAHQKELYLNLPKIYRKQNRDGCLWLAGQWLDAGGEGLLLQNINEFGALKALYPAEKLVLAPSLYQFNQESWRFFRQQGIKEFFAPVELKETELRHLERKNMELLIYGYQPLMVSAQCLKKTENRCGTGQRAEALLDRRQKIFRVKSFCRECYSVLYNSLPLSLLKQRTALLSLRARAYCLSFTFETKEETEEILKEYVASFCYGREIPQKKEREYTNGHFKRGVE